MLAITPGDRARRELGKAGRLWSEEGVCPRRGDADRVRLGVVLNPQRARICARKEMWDGDDR